MSQTLIKTIANFSTTLTTKTAVGATTGTLTSGLDADGIQLPTGTYGFTVDRNNASMEHFTATLTGDALTDIKTVTLGTGLGTAGLLRIHRKGAEVIISDHVAIKRMMNILDGTTDLDSGTILKYDGTVVPTTANQLTPKSYIDGIAIAGSPDSATGTKGIVKMSVAPASATGPIAVGSNDWASNTNFGISRLSVTAASATGPIVVGDNDGRVPTTGENDALVGDNTDIAVGSGNLFVTQTGLQKHAEGYAAATAGSDAYYVTLAPIPTSLVNGMVVRFKADVANTGAATLNVNGSGALAIVTGLSTALATGDIVANQVCEVIYNSTGTVWQLINPASTIILPQVFTSGTTTKDAADASTTQNIAHGLGGIPKKVTIRASIVGVHGYYAYTTYNGTTQSSVSVMGDGSTNDLQTTFEIHATAHSAGDATGVVTFDATNIIITWTKTNSPSGVYTLFWEAQK